MSLRWMHRYRALLLVAVVLATAAGHGAAFAYAAKPSDTVRLTIDYGDDVKKQFTRLAWSKGMSVLDALQAAARHPRGIRFEHRGAKATVFVVSIDDLENGGGGKNARNWTFRVNGSLAKQSAALTRLQPGDKITWKYADLSELRPAK